MKMLRKKGKNIKRNMFAAAALLLSSGCYASHGTKCEERSFTVEASCKPVSARVEGSTLLVTDREGEEYTYRGIPEDGEVEVRVNGGIAIITVEDGNVTNVLCENEYPFVAYVNNVYVKISVTDYGEGYRFCLNGLV